MNEIIDYDYLMNQAMFDLIKKALRIFSSAEERGDHHFFISFLTNAQGVAISPKIKEKYAHEMTIVLQYQFENLVIADDYFSVKLSFGGVKENIKIPFSAITSFTDPSVKFSLNFDNVIQDDEVSLDSDDENLADNIITLDQFRRK